MTHKSQQWLNKQSGFTLIEMMVVIAIIAILASIAYPSMQQQIAERRMKDARSAILQAFQEARAQHLILQRPIKVVLLANNHEYSIQLCATRNARSNAGCQSTDTVLQTYPLSKQTNLLDQHNRYLGNLTVVVKDNRLVSLSTLGSNAERTENVTYMICDKGFRGNARIKIRYEGNIKPKYDTTDGACPA